MHKSNDPCDANNTPMAPRVRLAFDTQVQGRATLHVSGDFDANLASEFRTAAARLDEATLVIVDLLDVPFMDSSGLGALMSLMRVVDGRDAKVQVICGEGAVRKLLHVTGVDRLASVSDHRENPRE